MFIANIQFFGSIGQATKGYTDKLVSAQTPIKFGNLGGLGEDNYTIKFQLLLPLKSSLT